MARDVEGGITTGIQICDNIASWKMRCRHGRSQLLQRLGMKSGLKGVQELCCTRRGDGGGCGGHKCCQ